MMKRGNLIFGVGVNDANYITRIEKVVDGKKKTIWKCPFLVKWVSMLQRCYYKKYQEGQPTYRGCRVCDEWLTFSNFKKWMEQQEWEGRQLDKDFLVEGNKIYSPDTCMFIPQKLNNFIVTCGKIKGQYPIGVCYRKKAKDMVNEYSKPYSCNVRDGTRNKSYISVHSNPEEAHQRYLAEKLKHCNEYISEFKDEHLIVKGLTRIRDKIQHHILSLIHI